VSDRLAPKWPRLVWRPHARMLATPMRGSRGEYAAPQPARMNALERAPGTGMPGAGYRGRLGQAARRYLLSLWDGAEASYRRQILDIVADAGPEALLDLGCHDGAWTMELAEAAGPRLKRVSGVEIVDEARALARSRGIEAVTGDLNEPLPFEDESFDVVHANQVIEHVRDLDLSVAEIRRVLRPNGRAVICTENLASWHNIAALIAGYMPFSLTNISSKGAIGNPFNLASTPATELDPAWFHTRVLTGAGLVQLFELHRFSVVERLASGYHPLPSAVAEQVARRDFRHAAFIGVVAERSAT
jgi:SAM-dependent methyltransferase